MKCDKSFGTRVRYYVSYQIYEDLLYGHVRVWRVVVFKVTVGRWGVGWNGGLVVGTVSVGMSQEVAYGQIRGQSLDGSVAALTSAVRGSYN